MEISDIEGVHLPKRYISSALQSLPDVQHFTASLKGVEADIYIGLRGLVVNGQLKPGTKLQEDVLCDIYGVSRTVIRKVLVIMEQEAIVALPPNRGAYIHTPTRKEAKDILEAARNIAIFSSRKLAESADFLKEADINRFEEHIALQDKTESERDYAKSKLLTGEFHLLLVCISGNLVLSSVFENIVTRLHMVGVTFEQPGPYEPRAGFQRALVDVLKQGDADGAEAIMTSYWDSVNRNVQLDNDKRDLDLRSLLIAQLDPSVKAGKRN